MNEQDLKNLMDGEELKEDKEKPKEIEDPNFPDDWHDFITVLTALRQLKKSGSTIPTHTPRNFLEQFYFFDDGSTAYVYIYF